jgi:hypothetical protein
MIFQLVYGSTGTRPFTALELAELLRKARMKNQCCGVTGMLLYFDQSFLQILEGDPAVVGALFNQISQDPRHSGVRVFHQGDAAQRDFPDWSMAFRSLSLEEIAELTEFNEVTTLAPDQFPAARARAFLKAFRAWTRIDEAVR